MDLSGSSLTFYFGFWLFALFFFWTVITIPDESLGPELTTDYHERTSLFAFRDGFLILGTLLAAAAPVLIDAAVKALGKAPDVIDDDQLLTGQRREGRYIGLWSIAKKLSAALGIGIGLLLLGNAGYSPNMVQNEFTVMMLRVLYALVPCLCNILAILIICFYPITEKKHAQIRREIENDAD